ncbi:F420-nonreducing hydrogenase [Candidatus Hecatella orcuttiae]|jgi:F420-non-reducing hydrogenase small subunit|uniref:NADH-quinone oxidoreductase subunit B family protein n=1 Tax=Candidatus Hecatella orcuttiae TaxID=1935119 RepID=UPI002867F18B|nr:F420-nonreducing hydrogenase [Candidatus Hecatella orcuttiae]
MGKLKLGFYWAASCGGCEISVLEIGEKVLDVMAVADIVFWPAAVDFKFSDVEKMEDKSIDVCFFNGAIRNREDEHVAKLLRAKSKVMIAFGSCAVDGCIPGLGNATTVKDIFTRAYHETPSTINPEKVEPQPKYSIPEGELELPELRENVSTLDEVVDVDYYVPGCPPVGEQVWNAIQAIVSGKLPPKGSVVGASDRALCHECERKRLGNKFKTIYRPYEIVPDQEQCLLEQGVICMGPATRGGCGALCPKANMPCWGCYGPSPNIEDQGAKMLSALASNLDSTDEEEIKEALGKVIDPLGKFYKFTLTKSILGRVRK